MRITDLQSRECFDDILVKTLQNGWSEQYGIEIRVSNVASNDGQLWLMQPLLSACYTPGVKLKPRIFLRETFQFTRVLWRVPAQWLLSIIMTRFLVQRIFSKTAFIVTSVIPNQDELLIYPGNQRILVFDFSRNICRVFLKHGFEPRTMLREISVRGKGNNGPYPRINAWCEAGRWFEEDILDGFALTRCPPWFNRLALVKQAKNVLEEWLQISRQTVRVEERISFLTEAIRKNLALISLKFPEFDCNEIEQWIAVLGNEADRLGEVNIAETHGDFQDGNIFVDRHGKNVLLIDWEHSECRYDIYDYLVYSLKTRAPSGLSNRLINFLNGKDIHTVVAKCSTIIIERRGAIALFLLEDIRWYLAENTTGPFTNLSVGLRTYCSEMRKLGTKLEQLFK